MLKPRMRAGLLGLGLLGCTGLPAAAQSWPSDSGPSGDYLGATLRQFERLSPPPIEAGSRSERVIPDMPATDVPGGNVDVGVPTIVRRPYRQPVTRSRPAAMRRQVSPARSAPRQRSVPRAGGGELNRELLDLRQEIRELRQELDQQRVSMRGGATGTPR